MMDANDYIRGSVHASACVQYLTLKLPGWHGDDTTAQDIKMYLELGPKDCELAKSRLSHMRALAVQVEWLALIIASVRTDAVARRARTTTDQLAN
jgi:hypothetical protein